MKSAFDLTLIPATLRQRSVALAVALGLSLTLLMIWPIHAVVLGVSGGFIPATSGIMIVAYLVTAALMLRQAVLSRRPSLHVLGIGFAFAGFTLVAFTLVFPGFSEWSALNRHPQAASWLWATWHLALPASIILAVFTDEREGSRVVQVRGSTPLLVVLASGLTSLGVIAASHALPLYAIDGVWQPIVLHVVGPVIFGLLVVAFAYVARRRFATMLDLFLGLTLFATMLEVISTLSGGARFTAGWYFARLDSFVATTSVLVALLSSSGRLSGLVADAERRTRSLIDGVADALIALDDARRITSFNPAAHALFGYASADIAGLSLIDVIPNFEERLRAHGGSASIEALGRHANGRTFPIEIAFGEGMDQDHRTIVIARDITQRKRAEAAIKAARDQAISAANIKAEFLATMSHEIRTPISAVVGTSELLLQMELGAEAFDYAKTVRDSAESLLGVINDILDFSKIEAGKMELDVRPISLVSIVESAADICAAGARAKNLALVTHVAPDIPADALGDANRIRQILINLVGNAVKFTNEGSVVVRAVVDRIEGDRTIVRFSVTDSGPGIAQSNVDALFEAFRQVDQSARRRHGGTGLGLSISKRLVEIMGGAIGVESQVGAGSTFWFTVPFEQIDIAARTVDEERPASLRGTRILLVVDDDVSRGIIEQYVMAWGVVATSTTNPAHAVALLRAGDTRKAPYDAVIVDFAMPTVDGFAFAARIRSDSIIAGTPLILVTSRDDTGRGAEALARGFGAYLRKPLKQTALFDALVAAANGDFGERSREVAPLPAAREGVLVLVAEDNAVNRKLALQQLKKLGYRAHAVADGREAIEAADRERYDVIFMDCQMPEVDGFEATQSIRKAERASGRHVPIVAMTANALEGDREACLAAGMDDYLAKPVQLAELRAMLERFTTGALGAR